jgi:eukaryotic-like serine/threonine-protein kinase
MHDQLNPFRLRGAIRDQRDFVGRRSELTQITAQLKAMQSVSVVGERRIGKSSLLSYLAQVGLVDHGSNSKIIYSDLPGVTDERTFYRRLCREVGCDGDDFVQLERALRDKRLIACLDEFERVASRNEFSGDFYSALRSLAQSGNLALVVATQHSLADLCKGRQIATSPFWNIFFRIDLGLFTFDEAEEFIHTRFSSQNMKLTNDEALRVMDLAGRFPFFLQLGGYHLFEMKAGRLAQWEDAFKREAADHLQYLWQSLSKSERNALKYILGFSGPSPAEHTVDTLASRGLVVWDGQNIANAQIFSKVFELIVADPPRDNPTISFWKRLVRWCKGGKFSVGTTGASGEIQFERPTDER